MTAQSLSDPHATLVPSFSEVDCEARRAELVATIQRMWGLPRTFLHNPAPNPISIERRHLPELSRQKYVVAEKSDGVRYLLLLTRDGGGRNLAVMADRTYRFWEVEVVAKASYFEGGSLFDGELVWSRGAHGPCKRYLAFDVVVSEGVSHMRRNYVDRIALLHRAFPPQGSEGGGGAAAATALAVAGYIAADGNPDALALQPKACFSTDNLEALRRQCSRLAHSSDGLIFTPTAEPVMRGTHWSMYKWKEVNSIDLRVRAEPLLDGGWRVDLFGGNDAAEQNLTSADGGFEFQGRPVRFVPASSPELEQLLAHAAGAPVNAVVECVCELEGDVVSCRVVRVRSDKDVPNNSVTIARTLVNIAERISFEELVDAVAASRSR